MPLVVGLEVLVFASQTLAVANTTAIYQIRPAARGRINAAYLVCYFAAPSA